MKNFRLSHYFIIAVAVVVVDQLVKYFVHQGMALDKVIPIFGDWFKLNYITNPGMAFGLRLDWAYGKVLLSSFRLVAMFGIGYYIKTLVDKKTHAGFVLCVAFILGGAVGNLLDSMIYAILDPALIVTASDLGGVEAPFSLFHGQVIDMFHIDIAQGFYPENWPIVGGDWYSFWPVFNVADAAIFCAVVVILIRQKSFFKEDSNMYR